MRPARPAAALRAASFLAAALLAAGPAAAQTLERIRDTGALRIGYRTDALPLSFADDLGVPSGYSVRVCEAVGEALRVDLGLAELDLVFTAVGTEDRFAAVAEGRIDLLCEAATVTLERRETVDFSIPTFVDGAAVLSKPGAATDLAGLAGARIGVRAGTTTAEELAASLAAAGVAAEIVPFETHQAGRDALMGGDVAAYFGDRSILIGLILTSGAPEAFALSDDMLTIEKHALALPRGDADFRLAVDRALSDLYRDGRMEAMLRAALPGMEPGLALQALWLIAPDLP